MQFIGPLSMGVLPELHPLVKLFSKPTAVSQLFSSHEFFLTSVLNWSILLTPFRISSIPLGASLSYTLTWISALSLCPRPCLLPFLYIPATAIFIHLSATAFLSTLNKFSLLVDANPFHRFFSWVLKLDDEKLTKGKFLKNCQGSTEANSFFIY